jgi:hypothetical protein
MHEHSSRKAYPSDLSDAHWEILEPLLPAPDPEGRPLVYARREIINANWYVLRTGCSWRQLPVLATLNIRSRNVGIEGPLVSGCFTCSSFA